MIIECIAVTGAVFSRGTIPFGMFLESSFEELKLGNRYSVMGMVVFRDHISYLIDAAGLIGFYPQQLFKIINPQLKPNWYFKPYTLGVVISRQDIQAICGFEELLDDDFCQALLSGEKEAVDIYYGYKNRADIN